MYSSEIFSSTVNTYRAFIKASTLEKIIWPQPLGCKIHSLFFNIFNMSTIVVSIVDSLKHCLSDFEYASGKTAFSSWASLAICISGYIVTFYLLSNHFGVLSKHCTDASLLKKANAQRAFYRPLLLFHNCFLSLASLVMLVGMLYTYFKQFQEDAYYGQSIFSPSYALKRIVCDSDGKLFDKLQVWLYLFYLSKFYEFLDTVFLCLTMRKVIPLHWIHHILTCYVSWIGMEAKHTVMGVAFVMNAAIHVIMYTYYAYKLVHPEYSPWWKEHLTKTQMIQFIINILVLAIWTWMEKGLGMQCHGEMWVIYSVLAIMIIFLLLFQGFRVKSYGRKNTTRKPEYNAKKKV